MKAAEVERLIETMRRQLTTGSEEDRKANALEIDRTFEQNEYFRGPAGLENDPTIPELFTIEGISSRSGIKCFYIERVIQDRAIKPIGRVDTILLFSLEAAELIEVEANRRGNNETAYQAHNR